MKFGPVDPILSSISDCFCESKTGNSDGLIHALSRMVLMTVVSHFEI